jgi:hypothetical protein
MLSASLAVTRVRNENQEQKLLTGISEEKGEIHEENIQGFECGDWCTSRSYCGRNWLWREG